MTNHHINICWKSMFIVLPKEFLDVRKVKGKFYPKFAGEEWLPHAEKIIKIYRRSKGKKLKIAKTEIKQIENADNYRKIRAFSRIVERTITFKKSTSLNPYEVRKFLFSRGFVTSAEERSRIIQEACEQFGVLESEIERAIFADMDDESMIAEIKIESPDELIRQYNLSLLQTSLFSSLSLSFSTDGNYQKIFRKIKLLGLMYEIKDDVIQLTGPASVLKNTRKYGISFAEIIPLIVSAKRWKITAEILDDFSSKIYRLNLSSEDGILLPKKEPVVDFDSELEIELYQRLKASKPELTIEREPKVVSCNGFAFIPDFRLKKGDKEVYIEIAGFWTPEYLRRKVEKIERAKIPLIVIATEELGRITDFPFTITYSKKLPYIKLLRLINDFFKDEKKDLSIEHDQAVNLSEVAERYGLKNEEIKSIVERFSDTHVYHKGWLIPKELLNKVKACIKSLSPPEITEILGMKGANAAVDFLGYRVIWDGLSPENAKIVRKDGIQ